MTKSDDDDIDTETRWVEDLQHELRGHRISRLTTRHEDSADPASGRR